MSWHCLICGSSEQCNGEMSVRHIGGGLTHHVVLHLKCLGEAIKKVQANSTDFPDEIIELEKENERLSEKEGCYDELRGLAKEMIEKSKQMSVPVIIIDDEIVVGFNQAKLDELLK